MDISVIIVSYNVKEYIISCIHSIYKHSISKYRFEIIVVDNNSIDGSVAKIKKEFPEVVLIKNNNNIGFSRAVNQGARKSKAKYLFILNPDTLLLEDSLFKLKSEIENIDQFSAIGPCLVSENGYNQQSFWRDPTLINTIISISHLDYLNRIKNYKTKKIDNTSIVDSISGGAFFLQRKIFNKLKGFDENLFWMEDIDFCIRLRKIGNHIYYSPKTKIVHYSGKSVESNYKIAISNQLISKIKFFKTHHSKMSAIIILFFVLIISLIKSALLFIVSPFSRVYRKKLIAYLYTIRSILFLEKGLIF